MTMPDGRSGDDYVESEPVTAAEVARLLEPLRSQIIAQLDEPSKCAVKNEENGRSEDDDGRCIDCDKPMIDCACESRPRCSCGVPILVCPCAYGVSADA